MNNTNNDSLRIPALIILHGPSATGKTELGKLLAQKHSLPFISKDDLKEILFDNLGWEGAEFRKKLGGTSFELMWHVAKQILRAGESVVIETKFEPQRASWHLADLAKELNFKTLQINCVGDGETLLKRFVGRGKTNRHPGHFDLEEIEDLKGNILKGRIDPILIQGKTIEIDTTDYESIDYEMIDKEVEDILRS